MKQTDRQTRKSSARQERSELPPKLFPASPYPDKKAQQASSGNKKRGVIVAPTPEAGQD